MEPIVQLVAVAFTVALLPCIVFMRTARDLIVRQLFAWVGAVFAIIAVMAWDGTYGIVPALAIGGIYLSATFYAISTGRLQSTPD